MMIFWLIFHAYLPSIVNVVVVYNAYNCLLLDVLETWSEFVHQQVRSTFRLLSFDYCFFEYMLVVFHLQSNSETSNKSVKHPSIAVTVRLLLRGFCENFLPALGKSAALLVFFMKQ